MGWQEDKRWFEVEDPEVHEAADRVIGAIWGEDGYELKKADIETVALYAYCASDTEGERGVMQKMGSRGGKKGGKARAEKLTPKERSAIARKAANARWGNDE